MRRAWRQLILLACCGTAIGAARSEAVRVTGTIAVAGADARADLGNVAVWLTPVDATRPDPPAPKTHLKMVQENKRFTPHMLVVRVGSVVDFPNHDPFFHNVFSLYDGKRFDLGLYEAGASRGVTFTRPGVCYVFCNIHPDMSAVIVVVDTPYYGVSTRGGEIAIPDVPPGRYTLNAWHERYTAASAAEFPRDVVVSAATRVLGTIHLADTGKSLTPHTNKYGHDYAPPPPANPVYR